MVKISFFEVKENWEEEFIENFFKGKKNYEIQIFKETINEVPFDEFYDSEIISVFIYSKLDKSLLSKFNSLKLIATRSTGFDHIDLEFCKSKKIKVANVPFYGQNTVAEYTMAHLLNISRKFCNSITRVKTGSFDFNGLRGFDLKGKKLGLLGFGHIGQKFAKMANGFEMEIFAYDMYISDESKKFAKGLNVKFKSKDWIVKNCDIISLHLPLTKDTIHILSWKEFSNMKKGVIILNTSRGDLIDSKALLKALNKNIVLGAGLDVLEDECLLKEDIAYISDEKLKFCQKEKLLYDHILINHPKVFVTPHNAFNTIDALKRILETSLNNINNFILKKNTKVFFVI